MFGLRLRTSKLYLLVSTLVESEIGTAQDRQDQRQWPQDPPLVFNPSPEVSANDYTPIIVHLDDLK